MYRMPRPCFIAIRLDINQAARLYPQYFFAPPVEQVFYCFDMLMPQEIVQNENGLRSK